MANIKQNPLVLVKGRRVMVKKISSFCKETMWSTLVIQI